MAWPSRQTGAARYYHDGSVRICRNALSRPLESRDTFSYGGNHEAHLFIAVCSLARPPFASDQHPQAKKYVKHVSSALARVT